MTQQPASNGTASSIGVLIVEDHHMVGQMIASTLATEDDITVISVAQTLAEADVALEAGSIDVVLMDYRLPDGDGISAAAGIRSAYPSIHVVIVTAEVSDNLFREALKAGCSGYLSKSDNVETLATAVRGAHAGSTAVSPDMLAVMMQSFAHAKKCTDPDALSVRELDVLRLLADGATKSDVAERLFISPNTVRNHTQKILEKLDAHSKLEAVTKALRAGLVLPPTSTRCDDVHRTTG